MTTSTLDSRPELGRVLIGLILDTAFESYEQAQIQAYRDVRYSTICLPLPSGVRELSLTCKDVGRTIRARQLRAVTLGSYQQGNQFNIYIQEDERIYIRYLTDMCFAFRDSSFITDLPNLKDLTVMELRNTDNTRPHRNDAVQALRVTGLTRCDTVDLNLSFKNLTHLAMESLAFTRRVTCLGLTSVKVHMGFDWKYSVGVIRQESAAGLLDPYLLAYSPSIDDHNAVARNLPVGSDLNMLEVELYHDVRFKADHALPYLAYWLRELTVPIRAVEVTIKTGVTLSRFERSIAHCEFSTTSARPDWTALTLADDDEVRKFSSTLVDIIQGLRLVTVKVLRKPRHDERVSNAIVWSYSRRGNVKGDPSVFTLERTQNDAELLKVWSVYTDYWKSVRPEGSGGA